MFNVLVLGHSFVKRADNFISLGNEGVTYNLGLSDATFCFMGVSGLQVAGLKDLKSTVSETSPDFIILDIGTNDIANGSDPIQLARQVYTIAQDYCLLPSVRAVLILDICPRASVTSYKTVVDFEEKADDYQTHIRDLCHSYNCHIRPVPLRRLRRDIESYLCPDGVHLSASPSYGTSHSGIFKYLMTIRAAAVGAIKEFIH